MGGREIKYLTRMRTNLCSRSQLLRGSNVKGPHQVVRAFHIHAWGQTRPSSRPSLLGALQLSLLGALRPSLLGALQPSWLGALRPS